jgi:3-(3-hydroxy-phenyl)propionate hydroxylase
MSPVEDAQARRYDVAIVGYGPVGATLAGLLGRSGLRVAVFEKAPEIYAQPRAVGFDHDGMRIFQRVGIAAGLEPHIAPFRDAQYFGLDGRLIQRVRHMPPPYPLTWAPNYTCDQPGVEAVLRGAIGHMANVDVALRRELADFADAGDHIRFEVRDEAGAVERHAATYLVACDGASSPVRRMLGIGLESLDYDEPWVVVDVRVDEPYLAQLPPTNVQYCDPVRPSTFITCPGNHRRWEFMTLRGEPADGPVSEARLWALLARWLKPSQARIWRAAAYRFHALIAREWRRGRVLLAGDSAHQTPPFLGQGMCQGLRDACNLAWKLSLVVRGQAPEALLDTYAEERRPHVVETTRLAKAFGRIISERDPERARERDARLLAEGGGSPRTLIRQDLIPGLTTGLIAPWAMLAGRTFPQPVVNAPGRGEILLDDLREPGFRLVMDSTAAPELLETVTAAASRHNVPVDVVGSDGAPAAGADGVTRVVERDGLLARWFATNACRGVLVRPDHYVYGGFPSAAEAVRLLDELAASDSLAAHDDSEIRAHGAAGAVTA